MGQKIPRAVCYARVSTLQQKASLRPQIDELLDYALDLPYRFRAIMVAFDLAVPGDVPWEQRPGLSAAVEALKPGDALVVWSDDRLARSPDVSEAIDKTVKERGASILYVHSRDEEGERFKAFLAGRGWSTSRLKKIMEGPDGTRA